MGKPRRDLHVPVPTQFRSGTSSWESSPAGRIEIKVPLCHLMCNMGEFRRFHQVSQPYTREDASGWYPSITFIPQIRLRNDNNKKNNNIALDFGFDTAGPRARVV